jgi:hypothetical protein
LISDSEEIENPEASVGRKNYEVSRLPKATEERRQNMLRTSTPRTPTVSHYKPPFPVHKWDVKFKGERKDFAVLDFIRRVNALAKAQKLSNQDLFESSYHLFEGDGEI